VRQRLGELLERIAELLLRLLLGCLGLCLHILLRLERGELLGSQRDDRLLRGARLRLQLLQLLRLSGEEFLQPRARCGWAHCDDNSGLTPQWRLKRCLLL
jgi:hypothetical protein